MSGPLFSIIIPTYNCQGKLGPTIESVLEQSCGDYELILVDGASTDGTAELIDSYRKRSPRLCAISEPDSGVYEAMNKGIDLSQGRFLYFLGGGDRLRPGVLETVRAGIDELPPFGRQAEPTILYGNVNWSNYSRPYNGRFTRRKLLRSNICHQAIFYERSVFTRQGKYDTNYQTLADYVFNIRCFSDRSIRKQHINLTIADFEGGGLSSTVEDYRFGEKFGQLVREHYGPLTAARLRVKFWLTHPRSLMRILPRLLGSFSASVAPQSPR